ncbi:hypothetical protein F5I97DRAFT_1909836 [Phlebopus sp. FC_14]|nr:hypothetical protein F5I97DRAFT_1909836 [Phlebopus sp. FC_14]
MINITLQNIHQVLGAPEPELSQNLTRLFAKLLDRNQDHTFVQNYTGAIKVGLEREASQERRTVTTVRFSTFGKACHAAGIAKTMLELSALHPYSTAYPKERYIAQSNALQCLMQLMRTGSLAERRNLLDEMIKHGAIKIFLRKLEHPLCIIRQLAVNMIRVLATESVLGTKISSTTAADIMFEMCKFALEGPQSFEAEMREPSTTWQSQMILGRHGIAIPQAAGYAPRYYAMAQESALWAVHGLLCTDPIPSRKFCLELLKKKPEILDLLFQCAIMPRPPCYPELEVASVSCEVLALLFQWPAHIVPGVSTPMDSAFKAQDWKAMSQCLTILTSREDWAEKIIEVWMTVEEEDPAEILRLLDRVGTDYVVVEPPHDETTSQVFENRGQMRISMLRLIATLTHAAESCGVTNAELESLLHIAYKASRKIITPQNKSPDVLEQMTFAERTVWVLRSPLYTVSLNMNINAPEQIADEHVLGPTALMRLLVVLAQRKALDTIQGLKRAPNGLSSSTSLAHLQQITHPDVIRRCLTIALERVRVTADKGRQQARQSDPDCDSARASFVQAAELAAAMVTFDSHTQGQYRSEIKGARKELVLALGNASEMAWRRELYQQALNFGHGAVTVTEQMQAAGEQLDREIMAKNKRRVQKAQEAMAAEGMA